MNFAGFLLLLITHYLSGRGLIQLFGIKLGRVATVLLSMICGVALFSFLPFILQLFHIPITLTSVLVAICLCTLLFSIKLIIDKKFFEFKKIRIPVKPYEYPFLLIFLALILISVWNAFYYPPVSRDLLSGPEVIAEYTVREHTMINSVFSVDLHTTNNHLKPPFIICLQIIYKLLVSPFGAMWLSVLFVSFVGWLYVLLREKLHPVIACFLLLAFFAIPEVYSYSFLVLFDYSNMIFFFCGFYFLARYAEHKALNEFLFAAFLFGVATYIRTETLALIFMVIPLVIFLFYKEKLPLKKAIFRSVIFIVIPAFFYFIWIDVFVKYYMPVQFNVGDQLNNNLKDLTPFFERLSDIATMLIFSIKATAFWGSFIFMFFLILLADIIFFRRFNREAIIALYGIGVVYVGLALLGYFIPWVDLVNTTKRGLFKLFPLMLLYLRNSGLLLYLSGKIKTWEITGVKPPEKVQVSAAKKPVKTAPVQSPKRTAKR